MKLGVFWLWLCLAINVIANPFCSITEGLERIKQRLHEKGELIGTFLDERLNSKPGIVNHQRFQNPDGLDQRIYARQILMEGLGAAESVAPDLIGDSAADKFLEFAVLDRVLDSNFSHHEMGRGFGLMAACAKASGIPDADIDKYLFEVFRQQNIKFDKYPNFVGPNWRYTEASFLRDWARLWDNPGNLKVAKQVHLDLRDGPTEGIIGNVHAASALKGRGVTIDFLDPDRDFPPGTYEAVDIVTPDSLIQVGATTSTIKGKIKLNPEEARPLAELIQRMETKHGKLYQFAYMHGDPSELTNVIGYLNTALADIGHNRVFTIDDFIKVPWNE